MGSYEQNRAALQSVENDWQVLLGNYGNYIIAIINPALLHPVYAAHNRKFLSDYYQHAREQRITWRRAEAWLNDTPIDFNDPDDIRAYDLLNKQIEKMQNESLVVLQEVKVVEEQNAWQRLRSEFGYYFLALLDPQLLQPQFASRTPKLVAAFFDGARAHGITWRVVKAWLTHSALNVDNLEDRKIREFLETRRKQCQEDAIRLLSESQATQHDENECRRFLIEHRHYFLAVVNPKLLCSRYASYTDTFLTRCIDRVKTLDLTFNSTKEWLIDVMECDKDPKKYHRTIDSSGQLQKVFQEEAQGLLQEIEAESDALNDALSNSLSITQAEAEEQQELERAMYLSMQDQIRGHASLGSAQAEEKSSSTKEEKEAEEQEQLQLAIRLSMQIQSEPDVADTHVQVFLARLVCGHIYTSCARMRY